eukprot:scaffold171525_cov18-Tisochrysis_lutea.AAC.2
MCPPSPPLLRSTEASELDTVMAIQQKQLALLAQGMEPKHRLHTFHKEQKAISQHESLLEGRGSALQHKGLLITWSFFPKPKTKSHDELSRLEASMSQHRMHR